jgi:PEP-CTERM motif
MKAIRRRMSYQEDTMTVVRLVLVVFVAFVISVPAGMPSQAEAIIIGSQGTVASPGADGGVEANSTGGPTIPIPPNPAWAPAEPGSVWVSFALTGALVPGTNNPPVVVPNGTIVHFTETFTLAGSGNFAGNLIVLADDSTSVTVDGVLLRSEASMAGNTYTTCSDVPIGCLTITRGIIPLVLAAGVPHTFDFAVAQRNLNSFGLDYAANLTAVPEPGTILLLGTGLIGLGGALRRRGSRED